MFSATCTIFQFAQDKIVPLIDLSITLYDDIAMKIMFYTDLQLSFRSRFLIQNDMQSINIIENYHRVNQIQIG